MRTRQLLIALLAMTLLVGACSNSTSESPTASSASASSGTSASAATPTSLPSATDTSAALSSASSSSGSASASAAAPTTVGPSASAASCTPEAPTTLSASWTELQAHDGDFAFKFPSTWDKIYGAFVFTTSQLVDAQTFAETGLPAASQTRADLVRLPGNGLPNASVLIVPGVTASTPTVFGRQLERFKTITDIKVIANNLVACLGGDQALGVSFTFSNDTTYQESWYVVHGGRMYDFQWLAPKRQEQTDTFREMFRTWQWTPNFPAATPLPISSAAPTASSSASTGASTGPSAFVVAGMTTKVDTTATAANPKDFVTTIPATATSIYAVFALKTGLTGQLNGVLKQGDKQLVTLSLQYGPKNTWGDFRINSTGGIAVGSYTMVIQFAPTGETINLPFDVK